MGCRVQSKSHEDANKREPNSTPGMAQARPEINTGQEDQWVVLRNEVEQEDTQRQPGRWYERHRPHDKYACARSALPCIEH